MTVVDLGRDDTRALGAYYTPSAAARLMAEWTVAGDGTHVLEPSMGEGVFLRAIIDVCQDRDYRSVQLSGVEYVKETFEKVVAGALIGRDRAFHSDFLAVTPFAVDAIVGNPPYVRLRHLPESEARRALTVAQSVLGQPMDPSGSVWMPFVLHATRFLRSGGRLALVLPYDFTYVRYARPLWRYLGDNFAALRLVRVRERIFSDILQDVVLLFADGFGGSTTCVDFDAFETNAELICQAPFGSATVEVADIEIGERPFMEALLPAELRSLLHGRLNELTVELGSLARFNIGYVSGDKTFFHPSPDRIERHALPASALRPAVTSARRVRGSGIFTSGLPPASKSWLFLPPRGPLSESESAYVDVGERDKVNSRYKCRVRTPWWIVPYVATPDLIVSVFSEDPIMLCNDAHLSASNSLLCGYVHAGVDPHKLVAAWYTPLTALQRELQVHALGGGVFVLVPNEISRIRVPHLRRNLSLARLDRAVRAWDMRAAYSWGRAAVLSAAMGLGPHELDLIESGRDVLARWRKSASIP